MELYSRAYYQVPGKVVILLICTCFLTYWNSTLCSFVFDDVSAIKDNRDIRPNTPLINIIRNDFWGTPMSKEQSHKSYRPLCVFTFRLNYLLHELNPAGYHLVNLILHCIVCILFYSVCGLVSSPNVSLVASLLFAVHPIHTEAVTGVVGRAELLSSIFFLLALLMYNIGARSRKRATNFKAMFYCVIFVALAMFSKEQGITVLGVAFIYEVFIVSRIEFYKYTQILSQITSKLFYKSVPRLVILLLTGICLMLIRFYVMGSTLPVFTNFDNPASYEDSPVRQLTFSYLIAVNSWLLINPSELCCDWTMGTIPLIKSLSDLRNLSTIFTFATLLHLAIMGVTAEKRNHRNVLILGLSLLCLPFLPASNLFFPVGFVVAERILYIPSMGFSLIVAQGFSLLIVNFKQQKKLLYGIMLSLLLIHSCKSYLRNWDWKDELSIFKSGLKVNSGNAKLFNNVGHALEAKEKFSQALIYFQQAVKVQPDDIGAHINVGRTFNTLERFTEAEEAYHKAKSMLPQSKPGKKYTARIAPQHLSVFLNLANLISKNPDRLEEADLLYRQAISMRSDYVQAYINLGDILIKLNRTLEAQEVYEKALMYDNANPDLYYNLGVVYLEQGKGPQALAYFNKALDIDPNHVQALMNSAILIQETGSVSLRQTAYDRLYLLLELYPNNDRVFFNLGMLAMDDENYHTAESWFRKAIEVKNDFRSALFNLALLLNEQKRSLEAVPFLKILMKSHPNHIKGLILLGDIYTNHVRDFEEATNCYQRIVEIEPNNTQAMHNLCVVMVEQGKLKEAEKCLREVKNLAPHEEYISRHLEIVQSKLKNSKQ